VPTDDIGNASSSFTGIDVGYGAVYLSVTFDYFLTTIYASGNAGMAYVEDDHKDPQLDKTINVTVYDVPEVSTGSVSDIKCASATVDGDVIKDNYDKVTERGVIIDGVKHPAGSGIGLFSTNISGLSCGTTHSVTAYATNLAGDGYGSPVSFTTLESDKCITVETTITELYCTYAKLSINVTSSDNSTVTESGAFWAATKDTDPNAEIIWNKLVQGSGTGITLAEVEHLTPGYTYHVKGYATTECGTIYGNEVPFRSGETQTTGTSVTDIDGNVYKTVTINTQEWMAENLKTTRFNDGTPIHYAAEDEEWAGCVYYDYDGSPVVCDSTPAYCWYNNDEFTYKQTYGALYSWFAADNGKLCPTGWHVPSDAEWLTLRDYLGGDMVVSGILKSTGTIEGGDGLWRSPNSDATNEVCFNGIPGGYRACNIPDTVPGFFMIGQYGYWLSSSWTWDCYWWNMNHQCGGTKFTAWTLSYKKDYFWGQPWGIAIGDLRGRGVSVRCVKDISPSAQSSKVDSELKKANVGESASRVCPVTSIIK
jgi:uncharacterized protein (TIGR02145 family)